MQRQDKAGDGDDVQYRRPRELSSHIATFPVSQVRGATVDRGGCLTLALI